jgi:hypothetical protein
MHYGPQVPDGEQIEPPTKVPPTFVQPPALASGPQTHPPKPKFSQQLPAAAGGDAHVPVMQSHTVPSAPGVPLAFMQSVADGS